MDSPRTLTATNFGVSSTPGESLTPAGFAGALALLAPRSTFSQREVFSPGLYCRFIPSINIFSRLGVASLAEAISLASQK